MVWTHPLKRQSTTERRCQDPGGFGHGSTPPERPCSSRRQWNWKLWPSPELRHEEVIFCNSGRLSRSYIVLRTTGHVPATTSGSPAPQFQQNGGWRGCRRHREARPKSMGWSRRRWLTIDLVGGREHVDCYIRWIRGYGAITTWGERNRLKENKTWEARSGSLQHAAPPPYRATI